MRKPWPAKRQRIRLGVGAIKQTTKPEKKAKVEEVLEEVKEEEQAEISAETTEEPKETEISEEPSGEEERIEGSVKYFNQNKGFGFITGDDGKEYYVHESELKEDATLVAGDRVSFKAVEGDKGMKAEEVELLK